MHNNLLRTLTTLVLLAISLIASAEVLEGTGIATIRNGNLEAARAQAREAAIRDIALQRDVRVSSEETVLNGRITDAQLTVSSRAQISNVQIVDERQMGDALRVTVRAQVSDRANSCQAGEASGLRKRVAVTGFSLQQPEQARLGGLDDAGQMLPQWLQSGLQAQGNLQVLKASGTQLYPDVMNAPTSQQFDNRLTNVINVARELGAQFVVAGVIRDIGVEDPAAWNTSILSGIGRSLGATTTERRFIADMMIYDGFSGSPVYQKRFQTRGRWNAGRGQSSGFASAGFLDTDYGQAVADLVTQMRNDIQGALECQPFMTRITRVEGTKVTIESGATAGLRPGDTLALYRSYSHFDSPDATPELLEADIEVTLDNVFPEYASGLIPQYGALENIQRGDIAIIW